MQGNHVGAPDGCDATMTPSVSSSHPTSPQWLRRGAGDPAYSISTVNSSPRPIGSSGVTTSFDVVCVNRVRLLPFTRTRDARSRTRSRLNDRSPWMLIARITAVASSRLVATL